MVKNIVEVINETKKKKKTKKSNIMQGACTIAHKVDTSHTSTFCTRDFPHMVFFFLLFTFFFNKYMSV